MTEPGCSFQIADRLIAPDHCLFIAQQSNAGEILLVSHHIHITNKCSEHTGHAIFCRGQSASNNGLKPYEALLMRLLENYAMMRKPCHVSAGQQDTRLQAHPLPATDRAQAKHSSHMSYPGQLMSKAGHNLIHHKSHLG